MFEDRQTRDRSRNNLAVEVLRKTGTLRLSAFGYSMLPTALPGRYSHHQAGNSRRDSIGRCCAVRARGPILHSSQSAFCAVEARKRRWSRGAIPCPIRMNRSWRRNCSERSSASAMVAEAKPVPPCTAWRRAVGLVLAYSGRLRSLALRWHKTASQRMRLRNSSAEKFCGNWLFRGSPKRRQHDVVFAQIVQEATSRDRRDAYPAALPG